MKLSIKLFFVVALSLVAMAQNQCQQSFQLPKQCTSSGGCSQPPAFGFSQGNLPGQCYENVVYQCPAPCQDQTYGTIQNTGFACRENSGFWQCSEDGALNMIRSERRKGFLLANVFLPDCAHQTLKYIPTREVL